MTEHQFEIQMQRLHKVYGDKFYPKERCWVIWEYVKYLSVDALHDALTILIGQNMRPVTINQIKDSLKAHRFKALAIEKTRRASSVTVICDLCKKTGVVWAKDHRGYQYVFKCTCEVGEIENVPFPKWVKNNKYTVIRQGLRSEFN